MDMKREATVTSPAVTPAHKHLGNAADRRRPVHGLIARVVQDIVWRYGDLQAEGQLVPVALSNRVETIKAYLSAGISLLKTALRQCPSQLKVYCTSQSLLRGVIEGIPLMTGRRCNLFNIWTTFFSLLTECKKNGIEVKWVFVRSLPSFFPEALIIRKRKAECKPLEAQQKPGTTPPADLQTEQSQSQDQASADSTTHTSAFDILSIVAENRWLKIQLDERNAAGEKRQGRQLVSSSTQTQPVLVYDAVDLTTRYMQWQSAALKPKGNACAVQGGAGRDAGQKAKLLTPSKPTDDHLGDERLPKNPPRVPLTLTSSPTFLTII